MPQNKTNPNTNTLILVSLIPPHAHTTTCGTCLHPKTKTCHHQVLTSTHTVTKQKYSILLRKEVIQPHLPVRLPCYDFVPIANPTFDHSPHQKWWLGHGLRVLPTFMT